MHFNSRNKASGSRNRGKDHLQNTTALSIQYHKILSNSKAIGHRGCIQRFTGFGFHGCKYLIVAKELYSLQLLGVMEIKPLWKRQWLETFLEKQSRSSSRTHPSLTVLPSRCCSRFCRWRRTCMSLNHHRSRLIWVSYCQPVMNTFWTWNIDIVRLQCVKMGSLSSKTHVVNYSTSNSQLRFLLLITLHFCFKYQPNNLL